MSSIIIKICVGLALLVAFALNINDISFLFWYFSWFVWVVLNYLSYVGASCSAISSASLLVSSGLVLWIIFKLYLLLDSK